MQSKFVFQGRIQFGFYIFLFFTYTVLIIKEKTRKNNAEPIFGNSCSAYQKTKTREKKRGAHFWEVDVQSDLDFRNLVKTMKKNIAFLKNVKSLKKTKTRKKTRSQLWGT